MSTGIDLKGNSMRTVRALTLALIGLCFLAVSAAQAAVTPAPGLKVVATTGPTHLPPKQSEIQRVAVEAEGGTFQLGASAGEGQLTPAFFFGAVETTAGSPVITIEEVEGTGFEVGSRVVGAGVPFETEAFVLSCSPDCTSPGSTVTLSEPAEETLVGEFALIYGRQAEVAEGSFVVGGEVQAVAAPFFPPGTVVSAVNGSTVTLSKPPNSNYNLATGTIEVKATQSTIPLAFDAPASAVQSALEAVPVFGAGSVTVSGGPGGTTASPYFVDFGGPLAEQDVAPLATDSTGLTGEHPFVHVFTTVPGGVGTGEIDVLAANVGALPTSGAVTTVKVGPLPAGVVTAGQATGTGWNCPEGSGASTVTCTTTEIMPPLHAATVGISIPVEVQSATPISATAQVELSGGGSPAVSTYQLPIVVSREPASFGVAASWAGSFEADGSPSVQAGDHPFSSAAYIMLNTRRTASGGLAPAGDSKNVIVNLPPGFTGNPLATKRCPQSVVLEPKRGSDICNKEMSVGNLDPVVSGPSETLGGEYRLYNDMPPKGYAAEFTTRLAFPLQSVVASVNSEEDFGIKLNGPNNANYNKIFGVFTAFEGVPQYGTGQALLTNPTNCAESALNPPVVKAKANTFQEPGKYSEAFTLTQPALVNCEALRFTGVTPQTPEGQVGFSFLPTANGAQVSSGSTPVGAEAHLHIANPGLTDPNALATPELKRSVIKLPEGMSLNPSSANGLEACSEAQIGYRGDGFPMPTPMRFNEAQPACPSGSKLGTAEIKTPLLDNPLVGEVFLAKQGENPFGSLLAIYLVVNDPYTGVLIKLPGEVQPDPATGRLTTVFDNNPQLPFEDLILRFRGGGPRSEFATSEVCGDFPTEGEWTPWSAPESGPPAQTSDSFAVSSNCAPSPGARPFSPSFEAGTTATKAGSYSPLVVKVSRNDGEQELTHLDFTLPKGLIGKLAGIPYCSEAEIAAAEGRSGAAEQANPSCPAASRVGSVDTAAGVGSEPIHVAGNAYLAGPYKGAPLSAVVITPALAGPLDLGTVVVRAPLYLDPESTQLTARSDAIPTILKGIPLKVRSVAINIDRPEFMLNPTSCEAKAVTARLGGGSGATATPSNRFQVGSCGDLGFTPRLSLSLKGGTKRNRNPALTAILTQPAGQANIGAVSVRLPHSEFLDQSHIRTVCTRAQFATQSCPAGAIYGQAEAWTPLLAEPLRGPVYLRSSSNKLPDLVIALKGPASQPIEVVLDGRIDSVRGGIRNSFEVVPDAPVSKFVLRMQGGKKGLLVNSTNICARTNRASVDMEGQNGKLSSTSPPVKAQCSSRKKHKKAKGHGRRSRSKRIGGR